jgi:tetratricopeptide (TPR) repeat protein
MKRKEFILVAVILLIAFAAITIGKYRHHPGSGGPLAGAVMPDSVQTFWTHYNQATEYRLLGKTDSSIIDYQEALKLNPDHEDALYYIGIMYMKADDFDKAQQTLGKLTELNPQSERAFIQLGNLYFCGNHTNYFHPQKSKLYFERAYELNKETLSPNLRLGEIALFQNRTNDALAIFNKLSMMDQKNTEIYFMIGYLNWKSGKVQDAIKDLEHTFELGLTTISNNEMKGSAIPSKNEIVGKNLGCDLFMDWLTGNLSAPGKYDIRVKMPEVYRKFDQYLITRRGQLNHD